MHHPTFWKNKQVNILKEINASDKIDCQFFHMKLNPNKKRR